MPLNRREMLRLGAVGAGAAVASSAAATMGLPLAAYSRPLNPAAPLGPRSALVSAVPQAPAGVDPHLFARAKAALNTHRIAARDFIGIADFSRPSNEARFHVVDLRSGEVVWFNVLKAGSQIAGIKMGDIRTDAGAAQMVERLLGRMKPGRDVRRALKARS